MNCAFETLELNGRPQPHMYPTYYLYLGIYLTKLCSSTCSVVPSSLWGRYEKVCEEQLNGNIIFSKSYLTLI